MYDTIQQSQKQYRQSKSHMFDHTFINRLHTRHTEFFSTSSKFKQFAQDVDKQRIANITEVQIECFGYGHFNKSQVLQNFFTYFKELITACNNIQILKISLHGFDLPQQKIIPKICADIVQYTQENIKTLWFHTGQLTNCTIEDFESMIALTTQLSQINFQDLSLQFSRWIFVKHQPEINTIEDVFEKVIKNAEMTKINNQRFRLQMSGWYYDFCSAKSFLKFKCTKAQILKNFGLKDEKQLQKRKEDDKTFENLVQYFQEGQFAVQVQLPSKVQEFHKKIQSMIRSLLEIMDHVKEFEIDFRNWNDVLNMKGLKKKLDKITKKDTYERSIISRRVSPQDDQNQNELKMAFVM